MSRSPTSAQADVLRLIARSLTTEQIAVQLDMTPSQVKARIASIGAAIGVQGRKRIVKRVFEAGLEALGATAPEQPASGLSVEPDLAEELLKLARMIVNDQPLGQLRQVAERALIMDARRRQAGAN